MRKLMFKGVKRAGAILFLGAALSGAVWAQSAEMAACTSYGSVVTTNLATWDLTQTRATGHNEITANALRIWTEGATSTDKAAGYYATNFPLSGLGAETVTQSLDFSTTSGSALPPGLQLVLDTNNDGIPNGILVGEPVYGNNWWASNASDSSIKGAAPHTGGGHGSNWYGTAAEWRDSLPAGTRVIAIGYSLGSGVLADQLINRITLGCVHYTFKLPPPAVVQPVPTLWPGALLAMGLLLAGIARRRLRS